MNKGFVLLLQSFGIKIDPAEIEAAWDRSKDALPQLARAFDELNATMKRVEGKLDKISENQNGRADSDSTGRDRAIVI